MRIGFKSLTSDLCLYIYQTSGDVFTLTMYVDDVIFLREDVTML